MYKNIRLSLFGFVLLLNGGACNEVGRYEEPAAAHEILCPYQAADIGMRTSWVPSALAAGDGETLMYADQGTRKLVALSVRTREIAEVADLSPYEGGLSYRLSGDASWGKSLIQINDQTVLLASPSRRLAVVDTDNGDVFIVGAGADLVPEQGVVLADADFSVLGGIGASDDRLFLAFDQRLFSVPLARIGTAQQIAEALDGSVLRHEAGILASSETLSDKVVAARDAVLHLQAWTNMLWHDNTLYYWENQSLMGIRDGRLMAIGGRGWVIHGDDLESTRLYGLADAPGIYVCGGDICSPGYSSHYLVSIHLDTLDFELGVSTGSVSYTYVDTPELSAFTVSDSGAYYGASSKGGGVWRIETDGSADLLFGLESEEARFSASALGDVSVSPRAVLSPLAAATLDGYLITLSTTLARLTLAPLMRPNDVTPLWIDLAMHGQIRHIASDENSVYFVNASGLERLTITSDGVTDSRYGALFKSVMRYGLPGKSLDILPTDPMRIYADTDGLVAYVPKKQWLFRSDGEQAAMLIESSMAFQFPTPEEGVELQYFQISRVANLASSGSMLVMAVNAEDGGKLVLANAGKARQTLAGMSVGGRKVRLLSSHGDRDIASGARIQDVQLPKIDAVALDPDQNLWFVADKKLWYVDDAGVLHADGEHDLSGVSPTALWVTGGGEKRTFFVRTTTGMKLWAEASHTWQDVVYEDVAPCSGGWVAVYADQLSLSDASGTVRTATLPVWAESVSCADESVYVAGMHETGKRGVWRASVRQLEDWERVLGAGYGVPDQAALADVSLGGYVRKIVVDASGTMYAWLRDTCTLWKIEDVAELSSTSVAHRVVSDELLCSAEALAVSDSGEVAVASGGGLYRLIQGDFVRTADMATPCFDMQYIRGEIVALTQDGLSVYRHDRLHSHLSSPVRIGDRWIDFAMPGEATPRFVAYPGQRAVILPVMYGGQVIKLGYE